MTELGPGAGDRSPLFGPHRAGATYRELVDHARPGKLISVSGIAGFDAYNPHLIRDRGRWVTAARVERRESDWNNPGTWHPKVMFFARQSGALQPLAGAPVFDYHEDPYASWITNSSGVRQLLLGAVTLDRSDPAHPIPVTRFYKAPSVQQLNPTKPVAELRGLKDGFRVLQAPDGALLMSTRPADGRVGENVLGLLRIARIEDVTPEMIERDTILLDTGLDDDTFLAVNEMHWVRHTSTGARHIGVLGCLSQPDATGKWSFAAAVWFIDPVRHTMTRPEVISERAAFPVAEPKADYLADVLFPGSLFRRGPSSRVILLTGVSDSRIGELAMDDPLTRYGYERVEG